MADQRGAVVRGRAPQIAAALGSGWIVDAAADTPGVNLAHPDGRRLFLHVPHNTPGRLAISGVYPPADPAYGRDADPVQITVSLTRPAEAIGREITRRLLPGYELGLAHALAQAQRRAQERAQRDQVVERLCQALPGTRPITAERHHSPKLALSLHSRPGSWQGSGEVYPGGTVHLTLHRLPADLAAALLEALHRHQQQEREHAGPRTDPAPSTE
jgi:hypothetical protein